MTRFVRDVLIFCGLNLAMLAYLFGIYDVNADYLAALNDKLDRLETKPPPRLIFIGGSSVAWSNHSQIASDAFDLEVQNHAIHAGMGLAMRIEEAQQLSRKGDVVVLSIEWGVFEDEPWARKMAEVAMACPRAMRFMNARDLKLVADGTLPALRIPFSAFVDDFKKNRMAAFSRASAQARKQWRLRANFNEFGDFVGHYNAKPPGLEGKVVEFPTVEQLREGIRRLNELHTELQGRDIAAYFFIPFIPESRYQSNIEVVRRSVEQLSAELTIPILNTDEFVFRDDGYFDSCYHLQDEPGARRTAVLVERLKPYLARKVTD